ncbi:MAG: exosortase/archaeosortase family protein [Planctomycetota bacterium]|nr:exosortase/archaeosortase family protein [Planctomycetota bacterium]MDA1105849.1 exosortase/archaeosortase family protein [Planctomycetota bacterium]
MGHSAESPHASIEPRPAIMAGASLLLVFGFVFFEFLRRQVEFAIEQPADWGHTLVIPAVGVWFVWRDRDALLAKPFRPTLWGLVPVLLGTGWYMLCVFGPAPLFHHNLQGLGAAMVLGGLTLGLFGWRAMGWLLFPLLYVVVFSQTISEKLLNVVTFRLQDWAAVGADIVFNVSGIECDREGNVLWIVSGLERKALNIAEACSGMRMLVAFLALGTAIAYTSTRSHWKRFVLILMGVPVALGVNILRVVTLGVGSLYDVAFAQGDFHTFIGLVWLVPAFLVYLLLIWVLEKSFPDPELAEGTA